MYHGLKSLTLQRHQFSNLSILQCNPRKTLVLSRDQNGYITVTFIHRDESQNKLGTSVDTLYQCAYKEFQKTHRAYCRKGDTSHTANQQRAGRRLGSQLYYRKSQKYFSVLGMSRLETYRRHYTYARPDNFIRTLRLEHPLPLAPLPPLPLS